MDHIEALAREEKPHDRVLRTLRLTVCAALHKADLPPPEDGAAEAKCPQCGKPMSEHGPDDEAADAASAAPGAQPGGSPPPGAGAPAADAIGPEASEAAGAGDSAAGDAPPADADPDAEGAEGEPDAIEALVDGAPEDSAPPAEGDAIEALADDGQNHGVGDLNEDGSVQSLVQEVTGLEKDYYAARGLHGSGSGKAEVVLDRYHRVVRKLVRAIQGGGAPAPAAPGAAPPADPTADPNADPAATDDGDDAAPAEGAPPKPPGAADAPDGDDGDDPAGDDAGGPPAAGKPPGADGTDDDDPEKKKNPFGKAFQGSGLRLGYYPPRGPGRVVPARPTVELAPSTPRNPVAELQARRDMRKSHFSPPGVSPSVVIADSSTEAMKKANATATARILADLARLSDGQGGTR